MKHTQRPATAALRTVLSLAAVVTLAPAAAQAQTVPPPGTSPQDIQRQVEALGQGAQLRERLRQSGLTPAQIRQQLASRGYDPSVLDAYLNDDMAAPPTPSEDALGALQALNIDFRPDTSRLGATDTVRTDLQRGDLIMPDSTAIEREYGLRVFGLRTFARGTSEFEPMTMGPVPPGYVLGPGDELTLILTGDVERAYNLPVTREGFVVIPQVGQVWVNGLTVSELRDRLYSVLGRAYSGIGRGPEATTQFEITLGRLRSSQLYVTGEVVRPGSYLTSAAASVLNALYQAGGPQPNGSFRSVRVMRDGQVASEVDLYAYLTRGDNLSDVMLQPGDVIFVPIHGPQVAVRGEVGRPAIYEMRPGEDLLDLLQYAGGLTAPAALGRARITRILPPGERTEPGVDRTVVEVDLTAMIRGEVRAPPLRDGDELRIFRVRPELRRVVTVSGAVWKDCALEPREQEDTMAQRQRLPDPVPNDTTGADSLYQQITREVAPECTFPYQPGMRAWDAIDAAEGLKPDALRPRAHILRLDPADSTVSVIAFSLETEPDGTPVQNPALQEHDALRIFSRTDFQDSLTVRISGEVREGPRREVRFREGLTLGDLLVEAGGLTPAADLVVEVTRRPGPGARSDGQLTETIRVPVDPSYIVSERGIRYYRGATDIADDGIDHAEQVVLRPDDHVFVRRLPYLEDEDRTISLVGEVLYPGSYMLRTRDERLSEVLQRAGGLSPTAFPGGFQFYREGTLASVDLERVLERPGSRDDVILLPGDSLVVPEYNPVVVVRGAVNSPTAVMYREGAGIQYYIDNAGGFARHADREGIHIRYANGLGAVSRPVLLFKQDPRPEPGSTITVPLVPEDARFDLGGFVTDVAQIAATIGTALLVFTRF